MRLNFNPRIYTNTDSCVYHEWNVLEYCGRWISWRPLPVPDGVSPVIMPSFTPQWTPTEIEPPFLETLKLQNKCIQIIKNVHWHPPGKITAMETKSGTHGNTARNPRMHLSWRSFLNVICIDNFHFLDSLTQFLISRHWQYTHWFLVNTPSHACSKSYWKQKDRI